MNPYIKLEAIISLIHIIDKIDDNNTIKRLCLTINKLFEELDLLNISNVAFIFRIIDEILTQCERLEYTVITRPFINPMKCFFTKVHSLRKNYMINKVSELICYIFDKYYLINKFFKRYDETEIINNLNISIGKLYQHMHRKDHSIDKYDQLLYDLNFGMLKNINNVSAYK